MFDIESFFEDKYYFRYVLFLGPSLLKGQKEDFGRDLGIIDKLINYLLYLALACLQYCVS